jgi:hypothetical protein
MQRRFAARRKQLLVDRARGRRVEPGQLPYLW